MNADNLLLTSDQKSLKLADFGLAREESVTEMMTAETGTYRWMAPEVCGPFVLAIQIFPARIVPFFHLVGYNVEDFSKTFMLQSHIVCVA